MKKFCQSLFKSVGNSCNPRINFIIPRCTRQVRQTWGASAAVTNHFKMQIDVVPCSELLNKYGEGGDDKNQVMPLIDSGK